MAEGAPKLAATSTGGGPSDSGKKFSIANDERLRYIGFDVGPKKIGELFANPAEEKKHLDRIKTKHEKQEVFRDTSNFREERVSGGDRIALITAAVAIILVFFLPITPMISGYVETRTEVSATDDNGVDAASDIDAGAVSADADSALLAGTAADGGDANDAAGAEELDGAAEDVASGAENTSDGSEQPAGQSGGVSGFQEVQVAKARTKITKETHSWSGLQLFTDMGSYSGALFSSGIFVILSAIVFLLFVLSCLAIPAFILFKVFTLKGTPDEVALNLKGALKLGWIPLALFGVLLLLSIGGGEYGGNYDSATALKQLGESYFIGPLIGLLGPGFYLALGGFIIAGAKSAEI